MTAIRLDFSDRDRVEDDDDPIIRYYQQMATLQSWAPWCRRRGTRFPESMGASVARDHGATAASMAGPVVGLAVMGVDEPVATRRVGRWTAITAGAIARHRAHHAVNRRMKMVKQTRSGIRTIRSVIAAAVLLIAYGCDDTTASRTSTPAPPAGASSAAANTGTVRVADIAGNPAQYAGQTVTVVADVEEVHGPMAFSLDEDAALAGGIDNDLLVISSKSGALSNIDDQWLKNKVRVTGTVGKMTVVEVEREVGWDLDRELEVEVEGARAVLIATSVERVR